MEDEYSKNIIVEEIILGDDAGLDEDQGGE